MLHAGTISHCTEGPNYGPVSSCAGVPAAAFMAERLKTRVLVLDDDYLIAETLRVILDLSGFDAVAVCDGPTAIENAKTWKPDILVTDVFMPVMNGFDAARKICAILPNCRIFLLSSEASALYTVREHRKLGYDFEFLQKPIYPSELLSRLRPV